MKEDTYDMEAMEAAKNICARGFGGSEHYLCEQFAIYIQQAIDEVLKREKIGTQKSAHAAYDEYELRLRRNESPDKINWAFHEFEREACSASLATHRKHT